MKIFVNDKEISIHKGAKVVDVVRSYFAHYGQRIPSNLLIVTDAYGNTIALDGELREGSCLYLKNQKTEV
ncbi:MAG: hypothetical protein RBS19_09515 [Bacteroidales bacterium]|nr:hypothetical protein [Bacteroidales bacterium]MDY0217181.1 hypothetical protein [Bacteroidales bacterium]